MSSYYLHFPRNRETWILRNRKTWTVKNHQQRFKWQSSILLNLIWHQVGFTKRHEVLNKQKSVYQNYKIIHFYDGIIS